MLYSLTEYCKYGVQNTREERKGVDSGTKEKPEEGTLINLTLAHA